ncbi:MAG TPA: PAS domain-containing sensor histidine kinase [Chloroflexota bacterium]|nr:PAS domain-containing sensor histidine kinase [Chloroflexota bacterium]
MKETVDPPILRAIRGGNGGRGGDDGAGQPPFRPIALQELVARHDVMYDEGNPTVTLHDTWAAMVAVDEGCRIRLFNREAERITGLRAHEVLGRRFCQALWPMGCSDDAERTGCPWQYAIDGREKRKHPRELTARIGDRRVDILLGARSTTVDQDRPGALITFVDLSQRREIERVRHELLAEVFHELRSPICAISMAAHFLNTDFDRLETERVRSMLATIQHNAGQLLNELNDLLNRSTFTVDTPTITAAPINLDPVIDQVIWKLEPLLIQRAQTVRKAYTRLPDVLADERRIEQVLVNLVSNANKYSVDGDEFIIDAVVRGDSLLVSIEDHGPGIDDKDRAHIFDRFYRAQGVAEEVGGAGLGLAIVRTIVEAHHGRAGVEDASPSGARFWFTLPLADSRETA